MEARILWRLTRALGPWLRDTLTPEECHARAREGLARRSTAFLEMLEHGIYGVAESPYRALLEQARIDLSDVRESVARDGVEETLSNLYEAGVYVTLEEFKGRRPIVRDGLVLETRTHDFDNPLSTRHVTSETGGSRSTGTKIHVDLAHYEQDAVYDHLFAEAFGLEGRPRGSWRPTLPYGAGTKSHLSRAKLGIRDVRWFSQNRLRLLSSAWKHAVLTEAIMLASRLGGRPLARPEHVPLGQAGRVARWLETCAAEGTPALLNTNAASGVRVAMAALSEGIDITASFFRLGGEPLTEGKLSVIQSAGADAVCHYTMGETGRIGVACAAGEARDDVHIVEDKIAVIQKQRTGRGGDRQLVNVYSTLLATTPKLMLNVESDDYGSLVRRRCGCLLDELGYTLHLSDIRSWEKLTSEGMNFIGADLMRLVDEVLPSRFGGNPTDYQFLEEEEQGLPKVTLLVSPRVGKIDEAEVSDAVLSFLDGASGGAVRYGDRWREGKTLLVRRGEPVATRASKVLALHTARKKGERR